MEERKDSSSPAKNSLHCDECDTSFTTARNLNEHIDAKHKQILLKCKLCDATTKWRSYILAHVRAKHRIRGRNAAAYVIQIKGQVKKQKAEDQESKRTFKVTTVTTSNPIDISDNQSIKQSKDRSWKCDKCDAAYKRPYDLKEHTDVKHNRRLIQCVICSSIMKWKCDARLHLRRVHGVKIDPSKQIRGATCREAITVIETSARMSSCASSATVSCLNFLQLVVVGGFCD